MARTKKTAPPADEIEELDDSVEAEETEGGVLSTSEVADQLGTDGKTLRKFFRSNACDVEPVGQGGRYGIAAEDIPRLKTLFEAYSKGKASKADGEPAADKAAPKAKKSKKAAKPAPTVVEDDDDEPLESLDDLEPTDKDLEDLDDELDDLEID